MSIINDMLKDLDSQRVSRNSANDAVLLGLELSGDINTQTQKILAIVIAASMLVMLAVFSWPYTTTILAHTNTAINSSEPVTSGLQDEPEAASRLPIASATRVDKLPGNTAITPENTDPAKTQAGSTEDSENLTPALQTDTQASGSSHIVTRQTSIQESAQHTHQQAVYALQNGQYSSAEELLRETLALDNSRHETRLLLANLYIRQQRTIDAESVLTAGLTHYPAHVAYTRRYAQLLVAQARYSEALKYLQAALPGATRDAEYNALLAGLYQRTGQALDAVKHYQVAVQLSPEKGEWWMGLGISLEQTGNSVTAYAAYQHALQYPLNTALLQYVNTRIRTLPRQQRRH